jgi:hypothetical protein
VREEVIENGRQLAPGARGLRWRRRRRLGATNEPPSTHLPIAENPRVGEQRDVEAEGGEEEQAPQEAC